MKFYAILITIIIIIIYVMVSCRYYILAYLKYFKKRLKYKKDVNDALKIDKKTRRLTNDTIDSGIKLLDEQLKRINYTYKGEFLVPDDLRRKLVYSKFSERSLKELFKLITEHMGITDEGVELKVEYVSSRRTKTYVGLYNEGTEKNTQKRITVCVNPDYTYETLMSIFIHECTHYYLLTNEVKLKDRIKNEYLTDIATIYFGFGKYILEGYKENKKIVFLSETVRTSAQHKVGYITYSDVKYIIKRVKKYR